MSYQVKNNLLFSLVAQGNLLFTLALEVSAMKPVLYASSGLNYLVQQIYDLQGRQYVAHKSFCWILLLLRIFLESNTCRYSSEGRIIIKNM